MTKARGGAQNWSGKGKVKEHKHFWKGKHSNKTHGENGTREMNGTGAQGENNGTGAQGENGTGGKNGTGHNATGNGTGAGPRAIMKGGKNGTMKGGKNGTRKKRGKTYE